MKQHCILFFVCFLSINMSALAQTTHRIDTNCLELSLIEHANIEFWDSSYCTIELHEHDTGTVIDGNHIVQKIDTNPLRKENLFLGPPVIHSGSKIKVGEKEITVINQAKIGLKGVMYIGNKIEIKNGILIVDGIKINGCWQYPVSIKMPRNATIVLNGNTRAKIADEGENISIIVSDYSSLDTRHAYIKNLKIDYISPLKSILGYSNNIDLNIWGDGEIEIFSDLEFAEIVTQNNAQIVIHGIVEDAKIEARGRTQTKMCVMSIEQRTYEHAEVFHRACE